MRVIAINLFAFWIAGHYMIIERGYVTQLLEFLFCVYPKFS